MKTDFSNAPGTLHTLTERDESRHILLWPTSDGTLWNTVASMRELFFWERIPGCLKTLVKSPIATRLNKLGHLVCTASGILNNPT